MQTELMRVRYDAVYEKYSDRFLTAAMYNWKVLYEKVLGDFLKKLLARL